MFSVAIEKFIDLEKYPALLPKAVFFDMDGILYDSMTNHANAWVSAMKDMNLPFTELDCYMNEGRTGHSTINNVFLKNYKREATADEKTEIYQIKSNYFDSFGGAKPMPFAYELLNKIKTDQKQIFVVTGSGQPSLLSNLQNDFPGIFHKEKMVTAFDVKMGKPNPEPYLMALEKSGVNPWEAIVIENAPLGVQSGSAAGLFTIGVNTGPLEDEILLDYGADIVLSSMEELFQKWNSFLNQVYN